MTTRLTALLAIFAKELRQTSRDRRVLALLVVAPVIQVVVLGYAVRLEVENVPVVVADEDHSPESRAFADGLTAGDAFADAGRVATAAAAMARLERGAVTIALVLPHGFARDRQRGRTARVQLLVDGGDASRALVAQNAAASYGMQQALAQADERLRTSAAARGQALHVGQVRVEPRVLYNPTLSSQIYFVPGVAATLLIVVTLIVTAMGLAREKESGTLEQVLVTPVGPTTLVLGKVLPYAVIGLLDLGLVVGAGAWLFDVPIRGSLLLLALGGGLYLLNTLGLGLMFSTFVKTQQQAFFAAALYMMPAILLSGFMTPVDNMPDWLRPLTVIDPVRHFIEVLRGVLLKAATVEDLAAQLVALAGLGLVTFGTATVMMRRQTA
jgi:ABC-2 type transport system permease protein